MKSIPTAFISTDVFDPMCRNGWRVEDKHPVYVMQPEESLKATLDPESEIEAMWGTFDEARPQIERAIVYLDLEEACAFLDRISHAGFNPRDVIFVLRECNSRRLSAQLLARGFGASVKHRSPYGVDVFAQMFHAMLDRGRIEMAS